MEKEFKSKEIQLKQQIQNLESKIKLMNSNNLLLPLQNIFKTNNLEHSNERMDIINQQTELLLNLNNQLDKDSFLFNNQTQKKLQEIDHLDLSNIKPVTYQENFSDVLIPINSFLKVYL